MKTSSARDARADLLPKFVGYRDVQNAVGVSRRTIERMVRDGKFPKPQQLTPNRVGWRADVVSDWLSARQRGLMDAAVADPSELKDTEIEEAITALAHQWLERRVGGVPDVAMMSVRFFEGGTRAEPVSEAFAALEGRFDHFEPARAILAACWLFPSLKPLIDASADPAAQAAFEDPDLLRDLAAIALSDDAWERQGGFAEEALGRPAQDVADHSPP